MINIFGSSAVGGFVNVLVTPSLLNREISVFTLTPSVLGTSFISIFVFSVKALLDMTKK